MTESLSLDELARATGEPPERLQHWRALGLISDGDNFYAEDLERARMIQLCLRRGIAIEDIARANQEQGILNRYFELAFPDGMSRAYSLGDAAEILGVETDLLRRFAAAVGFADTGDTLRERDIDALRIMKTLLDAGFPADALIEGAKVYTDSLGRVAEMESRLFHFHIHERLRAQGLRGSELIKAARLVSDQSSAVAEPALLYFHSLGWERAVREDLVIHLAEEAGLIEGGVEPEIRTTVMFTDLSGFTPLTAVLGDAAAAGILQRFSDLVRNATARWEGRVVKQIGDAFMLMFPDSRFAIACAVAIDRLATAHEHFPALRAGIHSGTVLYREGDYVGSVINIASRLAGEAQPHQLLVTGQVRREAAGLPDVEFVRVGSRKLKGVPEEMELFEVRPASAAAGQRVVDPVCGVEMTGNEAAASLRFEGQDRSFCSQECLRKFVSTPETYAGSGKAS